MLPKYNIAYSAFLPRIYTDNAWRIELMYVLEHI